MPSHTISVKVSDKLQNQIQAVQEDGETRSACVRRLIRTGLEEGEPEPLPWSVTLAFALAWIVATIVYSSYTAVVAVSGVYLMAALVYLTVPFVPGRFLQG